MPQGLTDSKPCLQAFMLSESSLQVLGFNFYFPLHHKLISHLGQSCSRSEIFSRHAAPCKNKGPPDLLIHEEHPECCHQSHFCTLVLKMAQLSLNTVSHLSPAVRYLNRPWMAYPLPWIPAQPPSSHQLKTIINWYLYDLNTHNWGHWLHNSKLVTTGLQPQLCWRMSAITLFVKLSSSLVSKSDLWTGQLLFFVISLPLASRHSWMINS